MLELYCTYRTLIFPSYVNVLWFNCYLIRCGCGCSSVADLASSKISKLVVCLESFHCATQDADWL